MNKECSETKGCHKESLVIQMGRDDFIKEKLSEIPSIFRGDMEIARIYGKIYDATCVENKNDKV